MTVGCWQINDPFCRDSLDSEKDDGDLEAGQDGCSDQLTMTQLPGGVCLAECGSFTLHLDLQQRDEAVNIADDGLGLPGKDDYREKANGSFDYCIVVRTCKVIETRNRDGSVTFSCVKDSDADDPDYKYPELEAIGDDCIGS